MVINIIKASNIIYLALSEAEENGDITAPFNLQTDESYDTDANCYSDGDNPSEAFVISALGSDKEGEEILQVMDQLQLSTSFVQSTPGFPTG